MSKTLKDFGFIAHAIERFFRFLQFLPPWVIHSNRPDIQEKIKNKKDLLKKTKKRALWIDIYIISFLLIEIGSILLIAFNKADTNTIRTIIVVIAAIRIVDILQVNINMVLFDHLRLKKNKHYMASAVRTIINNFINYLELIACFGIIYFYNFDQIIGGSKWLDAFYLSITSQLNLEIVELSPIVWNRLFIMIQGLLGFFFALLIFARVISILPHIKSVLETDS